MNTNKKLFMVFLILVLLLTPIMVVYADDPIGKDFCSEEGVVNAFRFLGYIILFVKILIPFAIILMGTIDIYKSVTSAKTDELNKQLITWGKRLFAGIFIFFLPTIINMAFHIIDGWTASHDAEYRKCVTCLLEPNNCPRIP